MRGHCLPPATAPHIQSLTSLRYAESGVEPGRTGQGEATAQLQQYLPCGLGQDTPPSASVTPLEDEDKGAHQAVVLCTPGKGAGGTL